MAKIIAYFRVSKQKQAQSDLGLEAQLAVVRTYADQHGAEIDAAYQEVERGANNELHELAKALAHAKKAKAVLAIAKLNRLSRDAHFLLPSRTIYTARASRSSHVTCLMQIRSPSGSW
jgi:DNA invertase Pin-like site-specific DNA recombinase